MAHLDALYDLSRHIYVDAPVQSKIGMNEHKTLVTMIDRSGILIFSAQTRYPSI